MMQKERRRITGKQIAFVPTMGYFHEGHLSLMNKAKEENELVIASIFVNPLQFGPDEDFDTYPRNEKRDILLAEKNGVDILFIPPVDEMYPTELSTIMKVGDRANVLCGRSRPGHFDGVVTVLSKLFNLIQPHRVYVGMKDAQQVAVIDGLIKDYNFPIELIGLPTIREDSGLAKSSRNVYLTDQELTEAVCIQKALNIGRELVVNGVKSSSEIMKQVEQIILKDTSGIIDYIELLSYPRLLPVTEINQEVILAAAVNFNKARLIDNIIFDSHGNLVKRIS